MAPQLPYNLRVAFQEVPRTDSQWRGLTAQLHPKELSLLGPRAIAKRRYEFAAGRVAARRAVVEAAAAAHLSLGADFAIMKQTSGAHRGRPVILVEGQIGAVGLLDVTLSHADGLAVAVAATGRLGMDLVTVEPHSAAFVEDTFRPQEICDWAAVTGARPARFAADANADADAETNFVIGPKGAADGDERSSDDAAARAKTEAVCMAFCAKEAALKWLGTGMGIPLLSVTTSPCEQWTEIQPIGGTLGARLGQVTVALSAAIGAAPTLYTLGAARAELGAQRLVLLWSAPL